MELLPEEVLDRPAATLSGGQKRRVAICRALCASSELLILDEPFTGLDAGTKADVIRYLQKKSAGKLTLLSTHQEEDIVALNGISITLPLGKDDMYKKDMPPKPEDMSFCLFISMR